MGTAFRAHMLMSGAAWFKKNTNKNHMYRNTSVYLTELKSQHFILITYHLKYYHKFPKGYLDKTHLHMYELRS